MFFQSSSPSLSIYVACSEDRSLFDHALSKQMSYFLRRADKGDGKDRRGKRELKRLKQSQWRQKISDDCGASSYSLVLQPVNKK